MRTALCFDLDGTLVHRTDPYEDVTRATLEAHGIEADDALVQTAEESFLSAFEAMEPDPFHRAMETAREAAGADADPAAMVETLRERTYETTTVPDGARESLASLGADDPLAVVTNGVREWQLGKLDHHDLTDHFDVVVASYEAGAHKPDPAPFDRLRDNLPADEYVMVGDDYEADVEGARAAGFVPVHYEREAGDAGPDLWATLRALV
ncbi:HAD family hydrolase [Halomicroarcula sp. GCM10025817]|uniref:HAD family hydrolase n=1 Tax=Haloarcula TaxID=2237 RepID=UPI0023E84D41|nr:HAD family hydrolase [Halomicroarcula sp. SYNS111]